MCTDDSDYSVVCGPRRQIESMIEQWTWFETGWPYGREVARPELIDLTHLDWRFGDPDSPAIAVISHSPGVGIPLTRRLRVEFAVGGLKVAPMPELVCEPGYHFDGSQGTPTGGSSTPQVQLDPAAVTKIINNLPSGIAQTGGTNVALLDTGIEPPQSSGSAPTMVDFTDIVGQGRVRSGSATDEHGHGTAMAEIMLAVNSNAVVNPVRVLDSNNQGECYEVLAGLQYGLYSDQFDLVVACLAAPATHDCSSSFGITMEWMLAYSKRYKVTVPPVIVAAGNGGPHGHCEYLAQMAGVVVVLALDDQLNDAAYNSIAPQHATTIKAYGGTDQVPVGAITRGSTTVDLWGTSVAAAAIAGAYLP